MEGAPISRPDLRRFLTPVQVVFCLIGFVRAARGDDRAGPGRISPMAVSRIGRTESVADFCPFDSGPWRHDFAVAQDESTQEAAS